MKNYNKLKSITELEDSEDEVVLGLKIGFDSKAKPFMHDWDMISMEGEGSDKRIVNTYGDEKYGFTHFIDTYILDKLLNNEL